MYCERSSYVWGPSGEREPPPGMHNNSVNEPSLRMWMARMPSPSGQASNTAAPAPSPNNTHVARSDQSTNFDSTSAPSTRTRFICPDAIMPRAKPRP